MTDGPDLECSSSHRLLRAHTRRGALLVGVLALMMSLSWAMAGPACACSCAVSSTSEEGVTSASGVFVARATEKVSDGFTDVYEFAVSGVFKGDVGAVTTVGTLANSNGCGTSYELGREYLLFVSRPYDVGAAWEGYACVPQMEDVRAVTERVYGPPRVPSTSASVDEITWWTRTTAAIPTPLAVVGSIVALGVIWWAVVVLRRRRTDT